MTNNDLRAIQAARRAHLNWVMKADALIQGIPVSEDQIPIQHTDCKFGQWYQTASPEIRVMPAFRAIEQPHLRLHETYQEIFVLLMQPEAGGFFATLIGKAARQNEQRQRQVKALFERLQQFSHQVVAHLDHLEQQLNTTLYES